MSRTSGRLKGVTLALFTYVMYLFFFDVPLDPTITTTSTSTSTSTLASPATMDVTEPQVPNPNLNNF